MSRKTVQAESAMACAWLGAMRHTRLKQKHFSLHLPGEAAQRKGVGTLTSVHPYRYGTIRMFRHGRSGCNAKPWEAGNWRERWPSFRLSCMERKAIMTAITGLHRPQPLPPPPESPAVAPRQPQAAHPDAFPSPNSPLLRDMATGGGAARQDSTLSKLLPPLSPNLPAAGGPSPQAPQPQTPQTPPMTIERATEVLDRDFDTYDTAKQGGGRGDGKISQNDLRTVAENKDGKYSDEQKAAAQLLLDSKAGRNFLDTANGKGWGVDGTISREDVTAAKNAIADGSYTHRMLDTAATNGGWFTGPDGKVSQSDIDAALNDPGMPQSVKDAIQLARAGQPDADLGFLKDLTADKAKAASELFNSPEYKALGAEEKKLVAQAWREGKGDEAVVRDVQARLADPAFQSASPALRADRLREVALLHSEGFKSLPASDQQLVRDTLAARRPGDERLAQALGQLMDSGKFKALTADEKTAVLSQMRNYPDSRVADNFVRLLDKSWFSGGFLQSGMPLDDKQRTLKMVGYLTTDTGGDANIRRNTLDRLLDPGASYPLKWENMPPKNNVVTWGYADGVGLTLNSYYMSSGNTSIDTSDANAKSLVTDTLAHEVSHLVNKDKNQPTYNYLAEEYRAWYVGKMAQTGIPPTNREAVKQWEWFMSPRQTSYPGRAALQKPEEAKKIFHAISQLTGIPVTDEASMRAAMSSPEKWKTNPDESPPSLAPEGDMDN